jgi:hypothetical protein
MAVTPHLAWAQELSMAVTSCGDSVPPPLSFTSSKAASNSQDGSSCNTRSCLPNDDRRLHTPCQVKPESPLWRTWELRAAAAGVWMAPRRASALSWKGNGRREAKRVRYGRGRRRSGEIDWENESV